jgi:hypothetical protein
MTRSCASLHTIIGQFMLIQLKIATEQFGMASFSVKGITKRCSFGILAIAVIVLLIRFGLALTNPVGWASHYAIGYLLGVPFFTYLLFIAEGLLIAGNKLRRADRRRLSEALTTIVGIPQRAGTLGLVEILRVDHKSFITGRGLSAVGFIVAISYCVEGLEVGRDHPAFLYLDRNCNGFGYYAFYLTQGHFPALFVATFLTFWFGQLAPHFVADDSPIQFMQRPVSKTLAHLSVGVGGYGAGAPGETFYRLIRRATDLQMESDVGIGDEAMYEQLCSHFGTGIHHRRITITVSDDKTTTVDDIECEYRGGQHSKLEHTIRLLGFSPEATLPSWHPTAPPGMPDPKLEMRAILQKLTPIEDDASDSSQDALIAMASAVWASPLPRKDHATEVGRLKATYVAKPPEFGDGVNELAFDISKPTSKITISIASPNPAITVYDPMITFFPLDNLHTLSTGRVLPLPSPGFEQTGDALVASLDFPPMAVTMKLSFSALGRAIHDQSGLKPRTSSVRPSLSRTHAVPPQS